MSSRTEIGSTKERKEITNLSDLDVPVNKNNRILNQSTRPPPLHKAKSAYSKALKKNVVDQLIKINKKE